MNKIVKNIKSFRIIRNIIFSLFVSFLFFGFSSIAKADTLYWYSTGDTDWTNVSNWWTNSNHTIQADAIPTVSDTAILLTPTVPVIATDDPNWIEAPSEINSTATTTGISIGCTSLCQNYPFVGVITGNVTFTGDIMIQGVITGNVTLYNNSYSDWGNIITGNATFYDNSYNGSVECTVDGNATFYNNSNNQGTITGNAIFYNNTYNEGTVNQNAIFNDSSYNKGSASTIDGNATFNYLTAVNGTVTDISSFANGHVGGTTYDSVGAPITTWVFSTTDNRGNVTGNAIFNNSSYYVLVGGGLISGNITFNYSPNPPMLKFGDVSRNINLGDSANFSFTMFNKRGNVSCSSCTYTVSTNPSSSISTLTKVGNQVSGSFIPTKVGTHSLIVTVTNPSDGSNATWNDMFFVVNQGSTITSETTRYYLRSSTPVHNSTKGNLGDIGSLMLSEPTTEETRQCSTFATDVVDEFPTNFPLSFLLRNFDTYFKYKTDGGGGASIGLQRVSTYDGFYDIYEDIPGSTTYLSKNSSFQNLNWTMNSPIYLYTLGLKLVGGFPVLKTSPSDISYADLNYQYTTTPLIRTTTGTNTDVLLLSATEPATGDTNNATIVLNNTFPGSLSTNLLIGDTGSNPFRRPFEGYTTIINSDGTATLQATGITGITTIDSVPLDITPNAGEISVSSITTASIDDGTTHYPNHWVESGTGVTSATHTIGNLAPNTSYIINVDEGLTSSHVYQSNSSGQLTFNYEGGYSTHTFDVEEASNGANITLFTFTNPTATGIINDNNISITVPYGTKLNNLIPTIILSSGATVFPSSGTPRNFSSPVVYTVTAQDGVTTKNYTVTVNVTPKTAKTGSTPYLYTFYNITKDSNLSLKYIFTKTLKYGMIDTEIKYLQTVLNQNIDTQVSQIGGGSPGKETNYFGKATLSAVKKFQSKYGLSPDGIVGKLTRSKLMEIEK